MEPLPAVAQLLPVCGERCERPLLELKIQRDFDNQRDQQRQYEQHESDQRGIESLRPAAIEQVEHGQRREHRDRHQHRHDDPEVTDHCVTDFKKRFGRKRRHRTTQAEPCSPKHARDETQEKDVDELPDFQRMQAPGCDSLVIGWESDGVVAFC